MLLIYLTAGWVVGIVLAALLGLPTLFWILLLLLPLGYLLIFWRDLNLRKWHLVLLLFVLGALRYQLALPSESDRALAAFNDQGRASLIGTVVGEPEPRETRLLLRVEVTKIQIGGEWHDTRGRALVQTARDSPVQYGDEIQVEGVPEMPYDGADFSYRDFLARESIFTVVENAQVYIIAHDKGHPFWAAIYHFKTNALAAIYTLLPDPSAALLAGILLGEERGIPQALREDFNATNTAHILAISGFNIAILAGGLGFLFRRAPGWIALPGTLAALVVYTILVGASASVVRACIMGSLLVLALHLGRQTFALNSLAAAAFVMTLLNPYTLWDAGFQLSFLATLGLILYVPRLSRRLEAWAKRFVDDARAQQLLRFLEEGFIVTLAAFFVTAPLIVALFHRLSLIGFLTNLLILPVQPLIMILGGVATLLQVSAEWLAFLPFAGIVLAALAQAVAWAAFVFLQYTILVVQTTAAIPFGSFSVPRVDTPIVILAYLIIFLVTRYSLKQLTGMFFSRATTAMALLAFITIFVWTTTISAPDPRTQIFFLATSGGDATYLRTASDERILVNGSAEPTALLSFLGGQLPPWDRRLDLVIATHLDDENLASLNAVLERFAVGQVVEPPLPTRFGPSLQKWRELIQQKLIAPTPARAGTQLRVGDILLEVLYPTEEDDAPYVVLRVVVGVYSFLLAPALRSSDRAALVNQPLALAAEVAVLPNRLDQSLLDAIQPQTVILFVGRRAREQPDAETLKLLESVPVLRTDVNGTILYVLDGKEMHVQVEK